MSLLGSSYPTPPTNFPNCSSHPPPHPTPHLLPAQPPANPAHPLRNTYLWSAGTPEGLSSSSRVLAIDAEKWDEDSLHNGAICDTNAAAAIGPDGGWVGIWRRCEGASLHTVPHTFTGAATAREDTSSLGEGAAGGDITISPNISTNFPFLSHAGAEDPFVWSAPRRPEDDEEEEWGGEGEGEDDDGKREVGEGGTGARGMGLTEDGGGGGEVFHAVLHDEQLTRCADAPVGCWPGGRHAFTIDGGATWDYAALDAWNGTVEWEEEAEEEAEGGTAEGAGGGKGEGTTMDMYLRARPHLLIDDAGAIVALSTGVRPTKASDYVYTLVQPVQT